MSRTDQSNAIELPGTPILPDVAQHLVKPNAPVVGKVHSTRICTKSRKAAGFVRHVEIDVSGTPLENAWTAGQSFGVVPPGVTESGKPHKLRLYSIAAPTGGETGDGTIITTTVKRLVDEHWDSHKLVTGECSNYLCDLNVGDEVTLTGPVGKRFLLPTTPEEHDYIFIATGTGIAPFRGMITDLINKSGREGLTSRVALFMGTPYESDLLYDDTLTQWSKEHEQFSYHSAISRHTTSDQPRKLYVQDRLAEDRDQLAPLLACERTLIYVCGIAGMELGVFQTLAKLLPPEQLGQYLQIDTDIADDIDQWERRMIPKKIKKTKRVFLEVY
jgi:ferredoxin--NADP+ reductase